MQLNAEAAELGLPPPLQAYISVVKGWANLRELRQAVDVVEEYCETGGVYEPQIFDIVVILAVRQGQFRQALKVSDRQLVFYFLGWLAPGFAGRGLAKHLIWEIEAARI